MVFATINVDCHAVFSINDDVQRRLAVAHRAVFGDLMEADMPDQAFEQTLTPLPETANNLASIASRLWTILEETHRDINSMARANPIVCVSAIQIEVLNGLLQKIIGLLEQHNYAENLRLLQNDHCYTFVDALVILGQYKGSMRAFRVNVLGEGPYTF